MEKIKCLMLIGLIAALPALTGCATAFPVGVVYTELQLPVNVGSNMSYPKAGYSECTSVLNIVAIGDASISAAMKNGQITKIHHVDWEVQNILGVIGKYRVNVYGE